MKKGDKLIKETIRKFTPVNTFGGRGPFYTKEQVLEICLSCVSVALSADKSQLSKRIDDFTLDDIADIQDATMDMNKSDFKQFLKQKLLEE